MRDAIDEAVTRIRAWGEAREWRGYDPYDGLNSPAAPLLTLGTRAGRRAFTQAVKLSPVNLRPLFGIRPEWNAKALGLVATAYARLAATGDASASPHVERWLDWLAANHSGEDGLLAWGYHFDVQTRFFRYRRGTPNTIATAFAGQAFLDGAELVGRPEWAERALQAARFLTTHMLVDTPSGPYFRYLPTNEDELVHNANVLACALLVRTAEVAGDGSLLEPARAALETSLAAQREDGSWSYSAGPAGRWVDNFHTGYILDGLSGCRSLDVGIRPRLERGLAYWDSELFAADGTPKYAAGRTYPLDAHCYATAIDTWLSVADWHRSAADRAERLARLLVERMLDPSGYVHFQQRHRSTNRVPYVRWTTAPTFRALAGLLLFRSKADARLD